MKSMEMQGLDKVEFSDDYNKRIVLSGQVFDLCRWKRTKRRLLQKAIALKPLRIELPHSKAFRVEAKPFRGEGLIGGGYLYNKGGLEVKTKGFINPNYTYFNPIDGFTIGTRFAIFKTYESSREIGSLPIPKYSFNRTKVMGDFSFNYLLWPPEDGLGAIWWNLWKPRS